MAGLRPDRGEFAGLLRRLRETASLTQDELAERAGLTSKAIGALERGERRRPYPHTVRALADALHVDEDLRGALIEASRAAVPGARIPPQDQSGPVRVANGTAAAALVGREVEVARLLDLVRARRTRLVTITGPGGVGKTRLAMAVAEEYSAERGIDVAVAELAAVRDVDLVLPIAARALGLRQGEPSELLDDLGKALVDRPRLLLLLDNMEQLLAAAPLIAELLARCPALVVLATSRAPLRIRAEQAFPLTPLALPSTPDLATIAAAPAVQMFLDRVHAVAPAFALTADNASAVEAVCRRLDGLPLALELAAAHARLLSPDGLLRRLDEAVGRPQVRDLPQRQATMRATLDWSHALLTAEEQVLWRRLSVFSDRFTLDAVELVAGDDVDAFAALSGLVEQSLVMPIAGADAYRMLEPVRQYAATHLADAGELPAVATRHAGCYLDLAIAARAGLRGWDQAAWLDRLHSEHGNLRTALTTLVDGGDVDAAGRLLADTWLYWALRGVAGEGLAWAERVLATSADSTPSARGGVHVALAGLRYATGNSVRTRAAAESASSNLDVDDDASLYAEALVLHGSGAALVGDFSAASRALDAALELARAIDDRWASAHALIAQALLWLGARDYRSAAEVLVEAEGVARDLASPFTLATLLNVQASFALLSDDDDSALDRLAEAAALAVAVGTTWTLVYTVPDLAVVAARRGLWQLAIALFSAASAMATASTLAVAFGPDREGADRCLADARSQVAVDDFNRAWDAGRDLRPEDISDYAVRIRRRSAPA